MLRLNLVYLHAYDEDATPSLENLDPQRVDRSFSRLESSTSNAKTSSVGAIPKEVKEVSTCKVLYTGIYKNQQS